MPTLPLSAFARYVFVACAVVVLFLLMFKLAPVLMLVFAGIVLATAVSAGAAPLERHLRFGRTWAVLAVVILVIGLIAAGSYFFGMQIATQMSDLVQAVTDAWGRLREYLGRSALGKTVLGNAQAAQDPAALANVAKGTISVFGGLADVGLVVMLTIYLATNPTTYRDAALRLLPPRVRPEVRNAFDECGRSLRSWLGGQFMAMIVVGLCIGFGLHFAGVPLAASLGLLSGVLEFIPFVGPLLAMVPGLLIAFANGTDTALYALIVYCVVLFIEGNVIVPIVQKWALELPPALTIVSVVVAGLLFGLVGVLFAVPLAIVCVILVHRLYVARIEGGAAAASVAATGSKSPRTR
jgi:predicted PurR-regulated permease PerM